MLEGRVTEDPVIMRICIIFVEFEAFDEGFFEVIVVHRTDAWHGGLPGYRSLSMLGDIQGIAFQRRHVLASDYLNISQR